MSFTYYRARCVHCGAQMRIGDKRTAKEIKAMLESGDALSSHSAACPAGWRQAPLEFTVTPEPPASQNE